MKTTASAPSVQRDRVLVSGGSDAAAGAAGLLWRPGGHSFGPMKRRHLLQAALVSPVTSSGPVVSVSSIEEAYAVVKADPTATAVFSPRAANYAIGDRARG